jgi:hypothetical protein
LVNIYFPLIAAFVAGLDRELSAIRPRSPRDGDKLESDCYGQMAAK